MTMRHALPWQLILADLALILFLVALSALVGLKNEAGMRPDLVPLRERDIAVAPAQALFRPTQSTPDIGQWLSELNVDPRATLTVFARYRGDDPTASWQEAQDMAKAARELDVPVRVVLTPAEQDDVYASLAFDEPR